MNKFQNLLSQNKNASRKLLGCLERSSSTKLFRTEPFRLQHVRPNQSASLAFNNYFHSHSFHSIQSIRHISTSSSTQKRKIDIGHQYPINSSSPTQSSPSSSTQHTISKGLLDTTLSCTTIDETGHVVAVSQSIPKTRFLSENKLYARDLRSIDRTPVSIIPCILVRDESILVNLLHIKAMIKYNKVLVFDTHDSSEKNNAKLSLFMYDLESKLQAPLDGDCGDGAASAKSSGGSSSYKQTFEMKALELILMNVLSTLETEMKAHVSIVNEILASLEDHIDRDQLKELLIRNKALSKFHQKSSLIRNVINELLDNDDDLVGMYLTEKHDIACEKDTKKDPQIDSKADTSGSATATQNTKSSNTSVHIPTSAHPTRSLDDHAEVELLLESYYSQCEEIVQQAGQVISNVKNTEDIINIILDSNRNSLMLMELKVTIGTLGFTTGMFFASLYGMNLENYIEETSWGFAGVTGFITLITAAVTVYNFKHLQRVRKMTMAGTGISRNLVGGNKLSDVGLGPLSQASSSASAAGATPSASTFHPHGVSQAYNGYGAGQGTADPTTATADSLNNMAQQHPAHDSQWLHPYNTYFPGINNKNPSFSPNAPPSSYSPFPPSPLSSTKVTSSDYYFFDEHRHPKKHPHSVFQKRRKQAMWAFIYRVWKGKAAERQMRKKMWIKQNSTSAHDSHRRDVVWRWLVESKKP